jgi:hypothetical protein
MTILTLEGIVDENGHIQLRDRVLLPHKTKVYVVIPELEDELIIKEKTHIYSPRLAHQEEAHLFQMEVIEET